VVKIVATKGGLEGNVEPKGAVVTVEGFMKFEVTTPGVEKTARDPDAIDRLSQCIQYPVPVLHSRLYYSLTIRNAQDQSCSNQEQ
jgi:hypothetical protein